MEITAKELREVEFRDRLRGYDTDEVDEFLEKVALGVDAMHAEIAQLAERVAQAERPSDDVPALDDESIRRTLILAQRTADMAIKEAQGEAERLLSEARQQSEQLIGESRDNAQRLRAEAEADLQGLVDRLSSEREQLERQVRLLESLLDTERGRLSEVLGSMLSQVKENFSVSEQLSAQVRREPEPSAPASVSDPFDLELPEVDSDLDDDLDTGFSGGPIGSTPVGGLSSSSVELDPDEELWERWSKSAEFSDDPASATDPFRFGSGEDQEPPPATPR